ncbi:hypothetical protein [Nostoc sp.]|uniref:hypothetical protein n=1 Tax=Nostoc sp. TaxID=1180 RepID=UPI002FF614A4
MDFRLKFNPKDVLYETLRVACFPEGVRGLALSVGAASLRVAMPLVQPLVEKALRCAIVNPKSKIELPNA